MKTFLTILSIGLIACLLSCASEEESVIQPVVTPPTDKLSITMLSHTIIPRKRARDVWGYIDQTTGKEYAIVGDLGGYTLIDVTDPSNAQIVSSPTDAVSFDLTASGHYLYIANGETTLNDSSKVVDISVPADPVLVGTFQGAQNLFIEGSYLYVSFETAPGLRIFDIGTDPAKPEMVWEAESSEGGYNVAVIRDRMYDFHGNEATYIYDVNDPEHPLLLGSIKKDGLFHLAGWVTEEGSCLFICGTGTGDANSDITVWDITDPGNAILAGDFSYPGSGPNNLFIIDNRAHVPYFWIGLLILDVSTPTNPKLLDNVNTNLSRELPSGPREVGAYGVYPFSPSGNFFISDINNGLLVVEID